MRARRCPRAALISAVHRGRKLQPGPQADGAVPNLPLTSDPVYSMTDAKNKYLYVLNHGTTNSNNANSTISAFVIQIDRHSWCRSRTRRILIPWAMDRCAWWKIRRASMCTRPTATMGR